METLVNHYSEHELPDIFHKDDPAAQVSDDEQRKTYSTQHTYDGYLRKWILPRWRSYKLSEVKAVEVEQWLKRLCFESGEPLAKGSKAKIRNIMRRFTHTRFGGNGPRPIRSRVLGKARSDRKFLRS